MFRQFFAGLIALCLSSSFVLAADRASVPEYIIAEFGAPPPIPKGPVSPSVTQALEDALEISILSLIHI